jgi:di/tripeptidase
MIPDDLGVLTSIFLLLTIAATTTTASAWIIGVDQTAQRAAIAAILSALSAATTWTATQ